MRSLSRRSLAAAAAASSAACAFAFADGDSGLDALRGGAGDRGGLPEQHGIEAQGVCSGAQLAVVRLAALNRDRLGGLPSDTVLQYMHTCTVRECYRIFGFHEYAKF